MRLNKIGVVSSRYRTPEEISHRNTEWLADTCEIRLEEKYAPKLNGIEEFSHIIVVYWMHKAGKKPKDMPNDIGIFATRTPIRPNPIGLSVVELVSRKDNILVVKGLDAIDGTPVLDIKPYIPSKDSINDAKIPLWLEKLPKELESFIDELGV